MLDKGDDDDSTTFEGRKKRRKERRLEFAKCTKEEGMADAI